jgi:small subunit ribosomal protein S4e
MKKHLKSLNVPVSWVIGKKENTFVTKPNPGKAYDLSMPLSLVFKNLLKYCKTMKEIKTLLRDKEIIVDGKRRKEPKYSLGVMDVLSIPVTHEKYRMMLNISKKLTLVPIDEKEAMFKLCKVTGKKVLKEGKFQLNLSDGRNILADKDKAKIGDTLVLGLPSQEIKEVLEFIKGSYAFMMDGKHTGFHGVIEEITPELVTIATKETKFLTPVSTVFIIGKEKPIIKMID